MLKEYKTVLRDAIAEYEEKKSRFIASVKPVTCEEEAIEFINRLKSKYWDASHNVYAYHIGGNNIKQRFSDDGEPSGTAGMPVMEVVKKMNLQDVAVVVTRYFGGTLLGASGLIRAYGKAASLGIEKAGVVSKLLRLETVITVEYTLYGKVQNFLLTNGYIIKNIIYKDCVEIICLIREDELELFPEALNEVTNANSLVETGSKLYVTVDENGKLIEEV